MYILEPERKLPVSRETDVLVCGGGIAGCAAALAAARGGARVLLLEREYMLGGLATAGLVTIYLPLCDGCGTQVSFGIAEELLKLSISRGAEGRPCYWLAPDADDELRRKTRYQVQFNPQIYAILLEQKLRAEGVEILYGTVAAEVRMEGKRISHVITENKSGRTAIAVRKVVDTTGDADLCKLAGEETATFAQGNVLAGWYYAVKNGEYTLVPVGPADKPEKEKTEEERAAENSRERYTGLDAEEISHMMEQSHGRTLAHFLAEGEESAGHALATLISIPELRMTRRVAGRYTQDDTEIRVRYPDSVGLFSDWRKRGPVYELPFGTLFGPRVPNLITAGRCISVTDAMWDITRVIPVCAVSGQAAGTAAAMEADFPELAISALQDRLVRDGVVLHTEDL